MKSFLLLLISWSVCSLSYAQNHEEKLLNAQTLFRKFTPATTDTAFVLFKEVMATSPNPHAVGGLAEVYSEKARLASNREQSTTWFDSTFYYADKALQLDKNNTSALYAKASAFNNQRKEEDAVKVLEHLLRVDPSYPRAARLYASVSRSLGHLYNHWYWSKKGTELEPGNPSAWWEHALSYSYLHEDSISAALWRRMIEADPKRGTGWGELGYLELLHGNTKGAVDYMQKAAAIDSRELQQLGLAYMLTADKQYEEAFAITQKVLAVNPKAVMYGTTPGQVLHAYLLKKLNKEDSARALAVHLLRQLESGAITSTIQKPATIMAALYLILDDKEKAMQQLSIDADKRFAHYRYIRSNPLFQSLAGYKPFEKLVEAWKKKSLQEKKNWQRTAGITPGKKDRI